MYQSKYTVYWNMQFILSQCVQKNSLTRRFSCEGHDIYTTCNRTQQNGAVFWCGSGAKSCAYRFSVTYMYLYYSKSRARQANFKPFVRRHDMAWQTSLEWAPSAGRFGSVALRVWCGNSTHFLRNINANRRDDGADDVCCSRACGVAWWHRSHRSSTAHSWE